MESNNTQYEFEDINIDTLLIAAGDDTRPHHGVLESYNVPGPNLEQIPTGEPIDFSSLDITPAGSVTAVDATVLDDQTYGADEENVLNNTRIRLNEVITALQAAGLIA